MTLQTSAYNTVLDNEDSSNRDPKIDWNKTIITSFFSLGLIELESKNANFISITLKMTWYSPRNVNISFNAKEYTQKHLASSHSNEMKAD